ATFLGADEQRISVFKRCALGLARAFEADVPGRGFQNGLPRRAFQNKQLLPGQQHQPAAIGRERGIGDFTRNGELGDELGGI
nr:hypothetical protein [Tanacetum cinerariifolium]